MAKVGIYVIECQNKVYVGQSIDIDRRIKQHIQQSQHQPKDKFYKAMTCSD